MLSLIIVAPVIMLSQNSKMEKLFNKYKDADGFELTVTDSDINMGTDESLNFTKMLNSISNIYIMNVDTSKDKSGKSEKFFSKMKALADKDGFKSMIEVSDEGDFSLLLKSDESGAAIEMLLISYGDDSPMCMWVF